jgi:hypothetical protein
VIDPVFVRIVSIGFGLMLLLASIHKFSELDVFRAVLADYRVLPPVLVPFIAVILPGVEAVLGLSWLFSASPKLPALATVVLLCAYSAGIVLNLLRGRVHISCGCGFGKASNSNDSLSWGLVIRNGLLIGAAQVATLPVATRTIGYVDYATVVLALLTIVLLYAAASQLLRNNTAIKLWRNTGDHDD